MSEANSSSGSFTEKLVAYLDGELPEAGVRDVEQTLANDPAVRAEVEKLNRAWELLDLLQQPRASEEFTSRTLSSLQAVDASPDLAHTAAAGTELLEPRRPSSSAAVRWAAWAAGLVLVAVVSFVAARRAARPLADPLLDDLPLIENLEVFSEIGDVQFLKDLKQQGLLDEPRPPEQR